MRIAVLSDIHANLEALDAVLERARALGADGSFVLGDTVGYGADPVAVLERIGELGARVIAGNHDLAAVGRFDTAWFNRVAAEAIRWTSGVLPEDLRDVLRSLDPVDDGAQPLLVHGSVVDPAAEYVTTVEVAALSFDAAEFDVCFFGHTHLPVFFVRDPGGRVRGNVLSEGEGIVLAPGDGRRFMVNPGSVGQPRDGDPRAAFLLYDTREGTVQVHRVEYEIERTQAKIIEAGLPRALADRLAVGR